MPPESPTVASWELNSRLKLRRVELGMDVDVICKALRFTRNYWSAVENDRKILAADKLDQLLDVLEFDKDEKAELSQLREVAKRRGWWMNYSALFDESVLRYFGLEHGAQSIRTYESLLVPGLLQTPEYAYALMSKSIRVRKIEAQQRLEVRMRRQERLRGPDPLQLTAVFSEATLLQQVGGPAVRYQQLQHLAKTIEDHPDNIEVRIVPFTATTHELFGASTFHLIDFESSQLDTLIWQEMSYIWGIISDERAIHRASLVYGEAMETSLSTADSLELIRVRLKELRP
ncbi:Scr1 family TA system antitoxin-like transcriptional regulator [Fodinicola acaciae]|uniref:Scr1 family TA system antitoxin-like transcriptional regulator n=1 Tax=Fodinicola acaciae TaxID=2681555 RepID=UPI0013D02D97|nr:Scr1 family TA system antitoxin-like transcriptional regulator [Fodinicola acaciae]